MGNCLKGIHYKLLKGDHSSQNLVFVHGSGCDGRFLEPLAKKLTNYNCYLIDLPDHGKSDNLNCNSAEDYVDAVSEFVSQLENVTIIGHSLGGTICLGVASKGIPSLKNCIIISSGAKFDKLDQRIHSMVRDEKMNWGYLLKCLGSLHVPNVLLSLLKFERPEIILKDFAIDIDLDLDYTMEKISIPTLIMVSENDILTLPEYSKKLHENIKNSRLIFFSKGRHMLPIAKRKQVAKLILDFIN